MSRSGKLELTGPVCVIFDHSKDWITVGVRPVGAEQGDFMANGENDEERGFGSPHEAPRAVPVARQFVGVTVRLSVYMALSARMRNGEGPQAMLQTLKNIADHEPNDGSAGQEVHERRLVKEFAEALVSRFENKDEDEGQVGPVLAVAMKVFEPKSLSFMEKVVLDVARERFEQRSSSYVDEPPQSTAWRKVSEILRDAAEVLRIGRK